MWHCRGICIPVWIWSWRLKLPFYLRAQLGAKDLPPDEAGTLWPIGGEGRGTGAGQRSQGKKLLRNPEAQQPTVASWLHSPSLSCPPWLTALLTSHTQPSDACLCHVCPSLAPESLSLDVRLSLPHPKAPDHLPGCFPPLTPLCPGIDGPVFPVPNPVQLPTLTTFLKYMCLIMLGTTEHWIAMWKKPSCLIIW